MPPPLTVEIGAADPESVAQVATGRAADWVREVRKEFRKEQYKKVFARSPFGSPEASIVYVLNYAAKELDDGHIAYARDLVDFAVEILDDGVMSGYYSASETRALWNVIVTRAAAAIQEASISHMDDRASSYDPR
jgi:hypothetical protein